jgi:hypothetical protein
MRAIVRGLSVALVLVLAPASALAQPVFVEIAREFVGGLMWLDAAAGDRHGGGAHRGRHAAAAVQSTRRVSSRS